MRICGPRRCIGFWQAGEGQRRICPTGSTATPAGTSSQCSACRDSDPGRALARDATPGDPRTFALYLASFGPDELKVGLTAVDRGTDRLTDQGALAFTWLARGPLNLVRRTEQAASATVMVRERVGRRAKLAGWGHGRDAATRREQLVSAHRSLTTVQAWPDRLAPQPCEIHDLARVYGLDAQLPPTVQDVTGVRDGTVVGGDVVCVAGRDVLLATTAAALLLDMRVLAGWTLAPTTAAISGVALRPLKLTDARDTQGTLF